MFVNTLILLIRNEWFNQSDRLAPVSSDYFPPKEKIVTVTLASLLEASLAFHCQYMSRHAIKCTFGYVRPTKTQISMASAQSDQSLRCPYEESLYS